MLTAVTGLMPVIALIALGWLIHRLGIVDGAGRGGIERLVYFVLFPALIVLTLARAEFGAIPWQALGLTLFLAVIAMGALCLALRRPLQAWLSFDGRAFTSLFQGATRWNTFVAVALVGSLFGSEGLALISVAIVAMVPVLNLMAVFVLSHYAGGTRPPLRILFKEIARNPLIWSCVVGLLLSVLGLVPVGPVATTLEVLGAAALPVGLLAVGAGLDVSALRRPNAVHAVAIALRLVVMPAIGIVIALSLGLEGAALGTALVALSVPTASNAYIIAKQLGGDAKLMAEIITLQTIGAAVTLPLWLTLMAVA